MLHFYYVDSSDPFIPDSLNPPTCYALSAPTPSVQPNHTSTIGQPDLDFPLIPFTHCQDKEIAYTVKLKDGNPLPAHIIYDPVLLKFTVLSDDNSYKGLFDI